MNTYNYIYKITNNINGKIYIGKHSTDNLDDGYMGSGIRLHQTYNKYGIENFNKEYLAFCDTKDKLNQLEKFYIKKYNSQNREIGYNLTDGGDGGSVKGRHLKEETKKKMSEAATGEKNPFYGRHHSEETKKKLRKPMSEETKKKLSDIGKGRQLTDEHKRKISEA